MKVINYNGSKWAGEAPDSIDTLVNRLAAEPLDIYWGACAHPARHCRAAQNENGKTDYIDMGPMFPEAPNTMRFMGNFLNLSAVFSIDTDEPELIETLSTAIAANHSRADYLAQVPA